MSKCYSIPESISTHQELEQDILYKLQLLNSYQVQPYVKCNTVT